MKIGSGSHYPFLAVCFANIQEDWSILASGSIPLFEKPNAVYISEDKKTLRLHVRRGNVDATVGLGIRRWKEDE